MLLTLTSGAINPAGSSKYGTDGVRSISGGGRRVMPWGGNPGGGLLKSGIGNPGVGAAVVAGGGPCHGAKKGRSVYDSNVRTREFSISPIVQLTVGYGEKIEKNTLQILKFPLVLHQNPKSQDGRIS